MVLISEQMVDEVMEWRIWSGGREGKRRKVGLGRNPENHTLMIWTEKLKGGWKGSAREEAASWAREPREEQVF